MIGKIPYSETDTLYIWTHQENIVNAIENIGNQFTRSIDSLTSSLTQLKSDDRILDWVGNDAIFTTLTSILVFSLGLLAGYITSKRTENKNRKHIHSFVKHHIGQIVQSYSTSLIKEYKNFAHDTTVDTGILLTPPKILSNDFERLLRIDSRELFVAFKNKQAVSEIIGNIDFLNHLLTEVQADHDKVLERSNALRNKIRENLNEYLLSLADLVYYEQTETQNYQNTEPYTTINNSLTHFNNELNGSRELMNVLILIIRPNQEFLVNQGVMLPEISYDY